MSSSMHAFGNIAHPGVLDRWPAPSMPPVRTVVRAPIAWPVPNVRTRVELPAPAVWGAPNPELLLSLAIAPLRFVPISWGPPVVVRSPWGPPAPSPASLADPSNSLGTAPLGAWRIWAVGLAAATAVIAIVALASNL